MGQSTHLCGSSERNWETCGKLVGKIGTFEEFLTRLFGIPFFFVHIVFG